tara:strand:- start:138 stop:659 length:522 start_codon:yes stop_codon:yes gene_type:complete
MEPTIQISNTILHEELQQKLNKHINMELSAFYFYMGAYHYFNQHDVALSNIAKFFEKQCNEEKEHAEILQKYLIMRFGKLELYDIQKPISNYDSILTCMKVACKLEQDVYESLVNLHKCASEHNDAHLTDLIEGTFLEEQVNSIKEINDYITNLKRVGVGLGEFLFDKHFQEN